LLVIYLYTYKSVFFSYIQERVLLHSASSGGDMAVLGGMTRKKLAIDTDVVPLPIEKYSTILYS